MWSWPAAATRAAIPRALKSTAWMQTARPEGVTVYHAGTKLEDGKFLTNGGRVLGIIAAGLTRDEEREKNANFTDGYYEAIQSIVVAKPAA